MGLEGTGCADSLGVNPCAQARGEASALIIIIIILRRLLESEPFESGTGGFHPVPAVIEEINLSSARGLSAFCCLGSELSAAGPGSELTP